jgi:hypothetical protein
MTDASLQQRLVSATERIRDLHADNQRLRTALAEALGANRDVPTRTAGRDTPKREETSQSIGPAHDVRHGPRPHNGLPGQSVIVS